MTNAALATSLIDGVILTELRQIIDERGAVLHMLRCDARNFLDSANAISPKCCLVPSRPGNATAPKPRTWRCR
jgi:hypothetical protein